MACTMGAIVKDMYNNPVDYQTSVWFSIINNPGCEIIAQSYVGNTNADGDSTEGIAYPLYQL